MSGDLFTVHKRRQKLVVFIPGCQKPKFYTVLAGQDAHEQAREKLTLARKESSQAFVEILTTEVVR